MAYRFFLDGVMLPIAPSKLQLSIENKNETMMLINDGEINLLNKPGLSTFEFEFLLPNVYYPFAIYEESISSFKDDFHEKNKKAFKGSSYYTHKIKQLKVSGKPFKFSISREFPNGIKIFDTLMYVSIEDYKIKEDSKNGFDVIVSIKLKEYKGYKTKIRKLAENNGTTEVYLEETRETENSPMPDSAEKYTVVSGDTLWGISKKFYGDGSKYPLIADKNNIIDPNKINTGQQIVIPSLT